MVVTQWSTRQINVICRHNESSIATSGLTYSLIITVVGEERIVAGEELFVNHRHEWTGMF